MWNALATKCSKSVVKPAQLRVGTDIGLPYAIMYPGEVKDITKLKHTIFYHLSKPIRAIGCMCGLLMTNVFVL